MNEDYEILLGRLRELFVAVQSAIEDGRTSEAAQACKFAVSLFDIRAAFVKKLRDQPSP